MITTWLLSIGTNVAAWVATLFPTWTPPTWLSGLDATVNGFFANFNGVGAWVNFTIPLIVVAAVLVVWVIGIGIKLIRAAVSYIPFFGGSG